MVDYVIHHVSLVTSLLSAAGYALGLLLVPAVVMRRRDPVATTAWILAIVFLPILGALLYLLFGTTRLARMVTRKRASWEAIDEALPSWHAHEVATLPGDSDSPASRLMTLANRVTEGLAVRGNRVELIIDTNRAYGLQEQAILAARQHIHIEYYIFQPDRTGQHFRALMIDRARAGVHVRFIYDAVGSLNLNRRFLQPLLDAGVEISSFLPVNILRRRFTVNLRNHRKLLVVDGRVGFTGGVNVGDEYVGRRRQFGYWRDTHLMIEGPAVLHLQRVFARDWHMATEQELTAPELYPDPATPGDEIVHVVESGPDRDVEITQELLFSAIALARHRVYIETCYFVPPESILAALRSAAHRGVEIKIIVPAHSAHRIALLAAQSYYEELLAAGVEIYQYVEGLMHAKILTIDGEWSLVSSANLDNRSLRLNFEVGAAFYGPRMARQLEDAFHEDLARSERIDADRWSDRSMRRRLMESTCRLLSPVL